MPYKLLADLVVALHFAFIVFVVLGGLLVFRWRWCLVAHVPSAVWAAVIEFKHWECPLTPLEKWLRQTSGQPIYEGGFMERYLIPIIYPPGLTHAHQVTLGVALVGLNLAIYVFWWWHRTRGYTCGGPP
jgi:hypothetical protein